jgi:tetratricopeptide (TPR) repeat protein
MKKTLLIVLLLSFGFSQQLIPVVETYSDGNIKSITYHKKSRDGIEKVKYEEYYENGQKSSEKTYKNGQEDGKWTDWYENGQKRIEGSYKDGERTDTWKSWDSLGVFHSASDWFDKGYNAVENKEYDKAIPFYLRAIELDPAAADAYNNLGNAYKDQGNLTKAIESYDKAIELKPDDAGAYYNLGIAYNTQGNLTKAIESYDKAIELKPDDAAAYWNRSIAKDSLGDKSGGMEDTKKAARLGHKGAQNWLKKNGYEW